MFFGGLTKKLQILFQGSLFLTFLATSSILNPNCSYNSIKTRLLITIMFNFD